MVSGSASVARPASFVHEPWNVVPVGSGGGGGGVTRRWGRGGRGGGAGGARGRFLSASTVRGGGWFSGPPPFVHEPVTTVPEVSVETMVFAVHVTPLVASSPIAA